MKQLPFFKKGLIFLCHISSGLTFSQVTDPISISTDYATQINATFANLDKTRIPHKLLVDYAMEFTELSAYNGTLTPQNTLHRGHLVSIYNTLLMSRISATVPGLINPDSFRNNWDNLRQGNKIVLSGLYYKYNEFKPNAPNNTITITNGKLYDRFLGGVWQNPYDEKPVFAIAAPILKYNKLSMKVELPASLWYTNQASSVSNIAIDFSDGLGYQTVSFGQIKNVSYTTAGLKEWKYRLTLTNNQILYSHSKIQIDGVVAPVQSTFQRTIFQPCAINEFGIDQVEFTGIRPYQGQVANAILEIDYIGTGNNCTITKPLIVVEGFDSGILGVENVLGENEYRKFRGTATPFIAGNLNAQLNTYDIIYINFKNGRDFLQRNAYLVEDVIKWVNSVKVGNAPNVVFGQSMGGIIARYALKDMENQQALNPTVPTWQHKTNLYISHDAPHQGANTPLALQYFSRHLVNQFIKTPLGDMNINISGDGAPVTISDLQKLLNAPGTKQLLIDHVSSGFAIDNAVGNAWRTELRNMGYPQQTRNIAISNANHCGNPQSFQPLDNLFTFAGSGQTSTLTDFILQLIPFANTISSVGLAIAFNEPGLLIGILPGNSKFELDFYGKALPVAGRTNQIYHGNIRFTKTLFRLFSWAPKITVTLTNRDYNAPGGLSYDYYPGGSYQSVFTNSSVTTPDNVIRYFANYGLQLSARDNFNFIPTPSALDLGRGTTPLADADFFRNYNAAIPPTGITSSPFANFTTSYTENSTVNEQHISFNRRNGDWLATELDANTANLVFDCSYICNSSQITGFNTLCTNAQYSVAATAMPGTTITWAITKGTDLATISGNGTTITLTKAGTNSGYLTLSATIGNETCGQRTITKSIWVGKPFFTIKRGIHESETCDNIKYHYVPFTINLPPDTSLRFNYLYPRVSYSQSGSTYTFQFIDSYSGQFNIIATATNSCGSYLLDMEDGFFIQSCDQRNGIQARSASTINSTLYTVYPNPASEVFTIDIKNQEQKPKTNDSIKTELYNLQGELKRNAKITNASAATIDVSGLPKGIYVLKINSDDVLETHQVIVE